MEHIAYSLHSTLNSVLNFAIIMTVLSDDSMPSLLAMLGPHYLNIRFVVICGHVANYMTLPSVQILGYAELLAT